MSDGWSDELVKALPARDENRMQHPVLITVSEFRKATGLPRDYVYAAIRNGLIRYVKVGNAWMIPRTEITEFVQREARTDPEHHERGSTRRTTRKKGSR